MHSSITALAVVPTQLGHTIVIFVFSPKKLIKLSIKEGMWAYESFPHSRARERKENKREEEQ